MRLSSFAIAAPFVAQSLAGFAGDHVALTSNGPIAGHAARVADANYSTVIEYLGIPYARPPTGALRFAAPQKYNSGSNATFIASHYGYTCPQTASGRVAYPDRTPQSQRIIANFAGQLNHTQSEDCLTLNVWTSAPPPATAHQKHDETEGSKTDQPKPVLVFIHGGRFTIGESNTPFFHGARLASAEPVVVVTVNYRVSIWGFPGDPALPDKNLAFRDQRLAVEWIRDNAAAFGGDAARIAIVGQSAGGAAVDYWAYDRRNRDDPLVAGVVAHSGNAFSFPVSTAEVAAARWYNVSEAVGCGGGGGGEGVVECLRGKAVDEIKAAVAALKLPTVSGQGRSEAVFQPTVDNETVFAPEVLGALADAGEFARVPYLVGNTHFEAGYYRWAAYGAGNILSDEQWDNFDLVTFTCPSTHGAAARARFGVPSWIFRYGTDWDNLRLYPNASAYHGSDMHALFGNSEEVSGLPDEPAQAELTRVVMKAWAAFAMDPWFGLRELGWEEYTNGTLIELGFNNSATPGFVSPQKYASGCASLNLTYYRA